MTESADPAGPPAEESAPDSAAGAVAVVEHPDAGSADASPLGSSVASPDSDDGETGDPDWAWVAEWRASDEPTPWAQGLTLGGFMVVLVASAIFVLTAGVADTPWLAVALNVLVAGGIGPQLWLARSLPVLRFIAWGAALGVLVGWLACFVIPFPD
jgi:hypothetical protein